MPASIVIELQALNSGTLQSSHGVFLHAIWFKGLRSIDPTFSRQLHPRVNSQIQPFTVSPLMDLHVDNKGICHFYSGQRTWFRVTTLVDELTDPLFNWAKGISDMGVLEIDQRNKYKWQVTGVHTKPDEHRWAGSMSYHNFVQCVESNEPPSGWTLLFYTPMTFHGDHFVIPQPEKIVKSWLQKWNYFADEINSETAQENTKRWLASRSLLNLKYSVNDPPVSILDFLDKCREYLVVENYSLETREIRYHSEALTCCTGYITLKDHGRSLTRRQTINLLAHYSFFCGSGYKTTQGLGQTLITGEI